MKQFLECYGSSQANELDFFLLSLLLVIGFGVYFHCFYGWFRNCQAWLKIGYLKQTQGSAGVELDVLDLELAFACTPIIDLKSSCVLIRYAFGKEMAKKKTKFITFNFHTSNILPYLSSFVINLLLRYRRCFGCHWLNYAYRLSYCLLVSSSHFCPR